MIKMHAVGWVSKGVCLCCKTVYLYVVEQSISSIWHPKWTSHFMSHTDFEHTLGIRNALNDMKNVANLSERAIFLIRHNTRSHWLIIALLSNVISLFVASQRVATYHFPVCFLSTYFWMRGAWLFGWVNIAFFIFRLVLNSHWSVLTD